MFESMKLSGVFAAILFLTGCGTTVTTVNFASAKLPVISSWFGEEPTRISGILSVPIGDGPFPAVVLLHTCGGVGPTIRDDWPNYLNAQGYATLVVDTYGSRGEGRCPNSIGTAPWIFGADAYGALDYLGGLPTIERQRIAVMGFSAGAMAMNNFITWKIRKRGELDFKAAISFYGRCGTMVYEKNPPYPVMEIVGGKDFRIVHSCKLISKDSPVEVQILPGAYHAFDSGYGHGLSTDLAGGIEMLYSKDATNKARELTKVFFAKHLGK